MLKLKHFLDFLYPHQMFVVKGKHFESKPLSKMDNKKEIEELVMGWGEDYVFAIHSKNGSIWIELKSNTPRILL
jgi:hypothetical protein